MGNLINLAVYNPAILDDDEFLEGFVARRELTERLLNRLREVTSSNLARHLLIIGQRGMGKTSMLRRLALGVAQEPALAEILIPLTFREEQYNVHNLHVFWCNCLDALGDYLEKHAQRGQAAQLDREIGKLASTGGDPDGNAACQLFKEWCAKEGKRPLLLVDNIDLIFGGLKEQQQWGLRRILQERGGVVMVGASAGLLEAVVKNEAPFYDFFQVHQLEKLSHQELFSCLRQIALKRGEAGTRVIKVLDGDPARIQTLYDLTGGNPRTLVLLYLLLELDSEGDVMDDLERLLDQVTALYKARVEDLAPQTRVVLDAVALAWNPVTVAGVAADTGIEATSVSSQFDRLIKMGILEKVSLSTPAPAGYQLGERFFNIWYLMRNASRRMRNRLRWLTEFLRRLYTPQQLSTLADDFISRSRSKSRCSGVYGLALSDALEDGNLRHAMNHHLTRQFLEQAEALCRQVDTLVDRSDLDQTTLTMAEMKKRVLECDRDWGNTSAEEFWDLIGGSVDLPLTTKISMISCLKTAEIKQIESIVEGIRNQNEWIKQKNKLPEAFETLRKAIRDGMLESGSDFNHSLAAASEYDSPQLPLVMIMLADETELSLTADVRQSLINYLRSLFVQSEDQLNSSCYYNWGRFLAYNGFQEEAERALRESIQLDPFYASPWNGLGILLSKDHGRLEEAVQAYRKSIELDPTHFVSWSNIGNLFRNHLKCYENAEQAYRKAIELKPDYVTAWFNLGFLLHEYLNRYDEAEQAYRKAIELASDHAGVWNNLGILLQEHLNRCDEAEQAFLKAIELKPDYVDAWNNLGILLQEHYNRYNEAEEAYRKAIELEPGDADFWNGLGCLLHDHLDKPQDAEAAYRKAIELGNGAPFPHANLVYLLLSQPERAEEADDAFATAVELLPEHGKQLLTAFRALTKDNFGDAGKCLGQALEQNHPELFTVFFDDLLRNLRLAKERSYGERLLEFLRESGLGERHWPLYAAFDAYVHGEVRLRDVNPEVRGAAQRIFDWLISTPEEKEVRQDSGKKKGRKTSRKS